MPAIEVTLERLQNGGYYGRVDLPVELLDGDGDECLGAEAEAATPAQAIEAASAKLIAMVHQNPELATILMPFAGPQLATVLLAARYLDAPDILKQVSRGGRAAVKHTAARLKKYAKRAARFGGAVTFGVGKGIVKGIGKALSSLW